VKEVAEVGTRKAPAAPNGKSAKKVIVMQATAYDPTAGSTTATGTRARVGSVAVDPKVIPLGSKLYIESMDGFQSYGYATAEDTGGAIKGNRIDLFYGSNREANNFGRRNVKVYVLD
ncbi:3D domain-containing protein, partial [Peptoniphilus lacydonensis]